MTLEMTPDMTPEMSLSATSLESLIEYETTASDDYLSVSDDDDGILHVGQSSRPLSPFFFSSALKPAGVPPTLTANGVSRKPGPLPHDHLTYLHPARGCAPAPSHVPRPQGPKSPPPPRLPPPHHQFYLSPPRPPPPPLRSLDSPSRCHIRTNETQRSYGNQGSHDYGEGFIISAQKIIEQKDKAKDKPSSQLCFAAHDDGSPIRPLPTLTNPDEVLLHIAHLREQRQRSDNASLKFMSAARELLDDYPQLHRLQQLFNSMQETRILYQEAEQRLEGTILEPYHHPGVLEPQQSIFQPISADTIESVRSEANKDCDHESDKEGDWVLRGIMGDRPESVHPLYEKLRTTFGKLQLARELLTNTHMKRELLRARKASPLMEGSFDLLETYGDAGKSKARELRATTLMTEDDAEQLQAYDELEQDAKRDIEIYTEKVKILQQACRENGVLPVSSYFQEEGLDLFSQEEIPLAPISIDSHGDTSALSHPVFPLLLSNPTHLLHDFPHTALQFLRITIQLPSDAPVRAKQVKEAAREANMHSLLSTCESGDKSEYINRWLLHKLHHSVMEAELLWTTFRSRLKILDMDRWQRDVLHFWWHDQVGGMVSTATGDGDTQKTTKNFGSLGGVGFGSYSDSGQLDAVRNWNLEDSWS